MKTKSTYYPRIGKVSRKRSRKWLRQLIRTNPEINRLWFCARYDIAFLK